MELVVDLDKVTVVLGAPDDLSELTVRVAVPSDASPESHATVHRLADVLEAAYVGRLAGARRAFVRPDAVVFHAAGQVDDGWDVRFAERCGEVADAGEVAADGSLPAPVRWPTDAAGGSPA